MSKRLMKTRLFAPWAVCCGAVLATALSATMPLAAASKATKVGKSAGAANQPPARDAESADAEDSPSESSGEHTHVRLNYLRASWKKVLDDVAKAMDKELVADELPAKTYSRLDRKQHSPDEALRILNRDLAAFGQKLVVKGDHLVLISVRQSRMDYSPAVIRGEAERAAEARYLAEQAEEEAAQARRPRTARKNTPAPAPADAEQVWPRQAASRDVDVDDADETPRRLPARSSRNVRQAGAEEEQAETARPAARRAPREEASADELIETEIRLKARDAGSIEKLLLRAFRGNTRRLDRGPGGLEGFAVLTGADEGEGARPKTRFRIGVDVERNTLVVEATERETRAVETLVKAFDKLPPGENGAIRAVPSKKATNPLARSLQGELDRLALATRLQAQAEEGDEERPAAPPAKNPRGAAPRPPAADAAAEPPAGKAPRVGSGAGMPLPQALQGSLKGEVSIEAVPDLNLFILKGNEQDVETVMGILKEIEKMSEASAPQVRMAVVEHLNSEALATLLTSVYDRISPTRQTRGATGTATSSVAIFPVARPNALLIVAPQADLDAILELLEELDQPSDPQTEYKVFRLKHAVPSQVVDTIREMYPSDRPTPGQAGGANANNQNSTAVLTPRVVVVPDSRTNSVIIQARARDLAEVAALIKDLDSPESSVVNQLKIYPLENATADELAATLQQALLSILTPARASASQAGGQGGFGGAGGGGANQQIQNEDLRDVKSSILEFLDANGGVERAIRSGIISDIRISPDARTNSIVVTAPPESIPMIESLIERLDQPSAAVAEIKVFPLQNADASGMVLLLEGLFSGQSQQQRGGALGAARQALGLQLAGTDDASSTLIPLRFEVDSRTNSIIAIGGAEALNVVHAVLLSLDSSDVRQRQNRVYSLRNTPAADVALAIQQFLTSRRQIEQQDPALVSAFDQFDREVVVVPEPVGNKLLISATPRYFDDIIQIIQDLDQVPKQVIIQALLVEVELSSNDEWGVELGLQDSILFDRSAVTELVQIPITNTSPNGVQTTTQTIISQSATPGYLFNNQQLGNNTSPNLNTSRLGTQGLSNFAVGRVNGDLGYGGLVLSAGSESVSVLLRALAARRRIDVLSRPQVQALDNQLATIQVGQEVPRVNSFTVNQTTGNATPLVQARNVGIILEVIPRVSPDGMVVMEVSARKDALNAQGVPLFTNPDGSVISSPIIDTTNAQTSVIVRNGQTIVLGGMITSSNIKEERKVPLLGDIPIIGQLFRADFKETRRTELLIFLTPRIIRNEEEAELIKEIETQRINFIECEAEAMHGPLFGVPAEDPLGIPASTGYGSPTSGSTTNGSTSFEAIPPMPRRDRSSDDDTPRGGSSGSPRMVPPDPGLDDGLSAVEPEPTSKRRASRAAASRAVASETDDAPATLDDASDDRLVATPSADEYTDYPLTPVSGTVASKSAPPAAQGSKSPASASRSTRGKSPRAPAQR